MVEEIQRVAVRSSNHYRRYRPLPRLFFWILLLQLQLWRHQATAQECTIDTEDQFRANGTDPGQLLPCGSTLMPLKEYEVGDSIRVGVPQLCAYCGALLEPSEDKDDINGEFPINLGWLQYDHWVAFDVALSTAGKYSMKMRIASPSGDGAFEVRSETDNAVYKIIPQIESTGDWQAWETIRVPGTIPLPSGHTTIKVTSLQDGWNLLWMELTLEEKDVEYNEKELTIKAISFPGDRHFSNDAGIISLVDLLPGHKLTFPMLLRNEGYYNMCLFYSNADESGEPQQLEVYLVEKHQQLAVKRELPQSGAWNVWREEFIGTFVLPHGLSEVMVLVINGGWNLVWLGFEYVGPGDLADNPQKYLTQASEAIEPHEGFIIEDLQQCAGDIQAGAVLRYQLYPPVDGTYELSFWLGSPNGWGRFSVAVAGHSFRMDEITPPTPRWHSYNQFILGTVTLSPAEDTLLEITVDDGGFTLFQIQYDLLQPDSEGPSTV